MSGINPYSRGLVFLYHSITFLKDPGSLNSKNDFERLIPEGFYHAKSLTMTEKDITSSNLCTAGHMLQPGYMEGCLAAQLF
jgi:hypothetical protein